MFPGIRDTVIDLAHRFDVPAVRVTRSASKGPVGQVMRRLAVALESELRRDGLAFTGAAAGLDEAGRLDEEAALAALAALASSPASSAELSGHPGLDSDDERHRYRWGYRWGAELDAALAPEVRRAVEQGGFRLGTFSDLARVQPASS